MSYEDIPTLVMEGMKRYVEGHVQPGNFLTAVIQNNLSEAIGRADESSLANIKSIVQWFYNESPYTCWGSPEKMEAWLK